MAKKNKRLKQSPTLNTILMVENTLKNADDSIITIAELKRKLPKQVNHNMLKIILQYLEDNNRIVVSLKGLTYIHNNSRKMKRILENAARYPEDFPK